MRLNGCPGSSLKPVEFKGKINPALGKKFSLVLARLLRDLLSSHSRFLATSRAQFPGAGHFMSVLEVNKVKFGHPTKGETIAIFSCKKTRALCGANKVDNIQHSRPIHESMVFATH